MHEAMKQFLTGVPFVGQLPGESGMEFYRRTGTVLPMEGAAGTICTGTIQLCRLRLARIDTDGTPLAGAGNLYVTDQQISLSVGVEISEGDDFEQKSGCGAICVTFKDCDRIKRLTLSLSLCTPEPELTQLLLPDGELLVDGSGNTRGFAYPRIGEPDCPAGVSIEAWVKNIEDGSQHPDFPYIRFVFPRTFWQIGEKTLENAIIVHNFTGFGEENQNWLDGPANDWPYTSDRVAQYAFDEEPPDAACGATALVAS